MALDTIVNELMIHQFVDIKHLSRAALAQFRRLLNMLNCQLPLHAKLKFCFFQHFAALLPFATRKAF